MNALSVSHYTYDRDLLLIFKSIFVCLYYQLDMNVISFYVYILSLVILPLKLHVHCFILPKVNKNLYIGGFLRVCCEHMWWLVFNERCTPRLAELHKHIILPL